MFKKSFSVIIVAVLGASVSACGQESAAQNPYQGDIQQVLDSSATSEYLKEVLEDFTITDEEYSQAKAQAAECFANIGIGMEVSEETGISLTSKPNAANSDAQTVDAGQGFSYTILQTHGCDADFSQIHSLYREMRTNPRKEEKSKLIVECLQKKGLAPNDYTKADYDQEMNNGGTGLLSNLMLAVGEEKETFDKCATNPLGANLVY